MSSKKIRHYEIKEELGRGGMAIVYLAYDNRHQREVALKLLPIAYLQQDPNFQARFQREVITFARLEHESIIPLYDSGPGPQENTPPFLVMRYMKGGDLKDKIKKGPMPLNEITPILTRIASALDYAHSEGVIHRDLKPSNILFDHNDKAYLADFGITKLMDDQDRTKITMTGATYGTPAYMSPEQSLGDIELDTRTDIYSLGIVLFEMITGQLPYEAQTTGRQLHMNISEPVPRILDIDQTLPAGLEQVIQKVLAKEPDERHQTAGELVQDYVNAISEKEATAPVPPPVPAATLAAAAAAPEVETKSTPEPKKEVKPEKQESKTIDKTNLILIGAIALVAIGIFAMLIFSGVIPLGPEEPTDEPVAPPVATDTDTPTPQPTKTPTNEPSTPTPTREPTSTPTAPPPSGPTVNGRLALVSNRGGTESIYLVDLDGLDLDNLNSLSGTEQITDFSDQYDDWFPRWCDDNTLVFERGTATNPAADSNRGGRLDQDLMSVRANSPGSEIVIVSGQSGMPGVPSCSKNGNYLGYSQQVNGSDFETGWSEFDANSGVLSSFNVFDSRLSHGGHVTWFDDERSVIFMVYDGSKYELYATDRLDPAQTFRLFSTGSSTLFPDLSPDNNWIVYACVDGSGNSMVWGLCLTNVSERTQEYLLTNLHFGRARTHQGVIPSWAPDQEWIAYSSDKDGDYDIYIYHLDSKIEYNLTDSWGNTDEKHPSWSP